jgi:hypothetical protein
MATAATADSRPRGCASACCAQHNAMGSGAYLLSAAGRRTLRAVWPLRAARAAEVRGRAAGRRGAGSGGATGGFVVPGARSCWSLPAAGCEPAAGDNATWRRLKPALVADHCLARLDLYGPALTAREAQSAWAAREVRRPGRAVVAAEDRLAGFAAPLGWRPFLATPPLVLAARAASGADGGNATVAAGRRTTSRLHGRSAWLALNVERGERYARSWWAAIADGGPDAAAAGV